jgi:molecular chaperone HscB
MLDLSKNYFELFGLPSIYVIDNTLLRDNYRELQRAVHPDRYANKSDHEQRLAIQGASLINEAFETLKDPLKRAQYLLTLHGVEFNTETETTHDTEFLMEQLELREELATIREQSDPLVAASAFLERVNQMLNKIISSMAVDFETPDVNKLESIRETIRKMQFLKKLHMEAQAVEAQLEEELI